jgi:hypothetical protein
MNSKRGYFAKYKQGLADYGLIHEELFVALGKELKEKSETKFNELIKKLNDPQWTLILTGKIYEVRIVGKKIDAALTELFTKNGVVEGAHQINLNQNRIGLGLKDNHFYLKDGQLHTIHIYNNSNANKSTPIYIPKEFSQIEYEGGRMASVVCTNSVTGQVIRASHILILSEIQLDVKKKSNQQIAQDKIKIASQLKTNLQSSANFKGSKYIGETGGPQGDGANYIHAHLTIFKSKKAMLTAMAKKYEGSDIGKDYNSDWKQYLGDFRDFVKIT